MAITAASHLDDLLTSFAHDPRLVHLEHLPARAARYAELTRPSPTSCGSGYRWSASGPTRPRPSTWPEPAGPSWWPPARRRASRSATRCRSPRRSASPVRPATALLLFPTKALAQDQLRAFTDLDLPRLVAATYDGDCAPEERTWVRRHANVLLTNPEMLHHGILPNHGRWATFLMRLRYVVVDELHVLRGVFGSHVAHLLRRLRRLCARYGARPDLHLLVGHHRRARPRWPPSSAASTSSRSPTTARPRRALFALWNPRRDEPSRPPGRPRRLGDEPDARLTRRRPAAGPTAMAPVADVTAVEAGRAPSANRETACSSPSCPAGHRTIAFCRSRKGTEVVAADVRRPAARRPGRPRPPLPGRLPGRRAPRDRGRAVRRASSAAWSPPPRSSSASTSAGSTPACSTASPAPSPRCGSRPGGPGARPSSRSPCWSPATTSSTSGYMAHPARGVHPPARAGGHQPGQPLRAATRTSPAPPTSSRSPTPTSATGPGPARRRRARPRARRPAAGPRPRSRIGAGAAGGVGRSRVAQRTASGCAAARTTRSASSPDDGTLVGTVDRGRACSIVHPGAIYLHQGRTYRVDELDLDDGVAVVEPPTAASTPSPAPRPTSASSAPSAQRQVGRSAPAPRVRCEVSPQVIGYQRRRRRSPASCSAPRSSTCRRPSSSPGRSGTRSTPTCSTTRASTRPRLARHAARRRARRHRHPAAVHHLRPLGRRRRVHRRSRPTPVCPRSSSTTATPAAPASPSWATPAADRHLAGHPRGDRRLPVRRRVARRACSRPSAATATSPSTSTGRSRCSERCWPRPRPDPGASDPDPAGEEITAPPAA